jgi:WD40 repeat protein
MYKLLLVFFILLINAYGIKTLKPTSIYKSKGSVLDIVVKNGKIYTSTSAGLVDVIDFKSKKIIQEIKLPKIHDFMGDLIDSHLVSVDAFGDKILFVAQAEHGKNEIYLYNKKLKQIISKEQGLSIVKARFINDRYFIFATLDSELYYFDLKAKKILWKADIRADDEEFNSKFSDFAFNNDKTKIAAADESGNVKILNLSTKKVEKVLSGVNLDNIFKLDWKQNLIITAGKDKKAVIYDLSSNTHYIMSTDFFIYGAALSSDVTLGAYSLDPQNNVVVFNINTKAKKYKLTDNKMTITSIIFINNHEVIIASDSNQINYYKLK